MTIKHQISGSPWESYNCVAHESERDSAWWCHYALCNGFYLGHSHWTHAWECHDKRIGSRLSQQFSVVRLVSQNMATLMEYTECVTFTWESNQPLTTCMLQWEEMLFMTLIVHYIPTNPSTTKPNFDFFKRELGFLKLTFIDGENSIDLYEFWLLKFSALILPKSVLYRIL